LAAESDEDVAAGLEVVVEGAVAGREVVEGTVAVPRRVPARTRRKAYRFFI